MSAAATIHSASDFSIEAQAINGMEHKVLANLDTPERDSLAEDILALRAHDVPNGEIAALLGRLADALDLNAQEGTCERSITGLLEVLTTPAGRTLLAEEAGGGGAKALAVRLRPALRVLGRAEDYAHDPGALVAAASIVATAIQTTAPAALESQGLRHELGARAHDRLLRFRDGVA